MAAALVRSGVCLFALLIGDICCVPVQKGNDPAAYDDSYRHAAPSYDPQPGPRSGPGFGPQPGPGYGPGFGPQSGQGLAPPVVPQSGPGYGPQPGPRSGPGYGPEPGPRSGPGYGPQPGPRSGPGYGPQPGPGYGPQPGPGYGPQPSPRSGPGFGPQSGQGVAPQSGHYPLGSVSKGGSSPYYYPEMKPGYDQPSDWYVEPAWPGPMGKAPLAPAGVGSEYIRPPIPQPAYQGGELTHYEDSAEHGFYELESDEQGQFPHPPHNFASPEMVSSSMPHPLPPHPLPQHPVLPHWGFYPYYYDYMFITGQYPPGTYTHASADFEHGRDAWQDVHYRQEGIPFEPVAESGASTSSVASLPGKAPVVYTGH